jgi:hypothetical protein
MGNDVRDSLKLLKVDDLAARLQVPRSWVYSHAADLGAYRLGKYLRFDWERVRERLSQLGPEPNDPIRRPSNEGFKSTIERICNK